MPRVRDRLYRFRPAGAPGSASAAGVPTDRGADLAAELAPLFAELAKTERECADISAHAERDAAEVRARDAERARNLVTAARARLDGERADAVARLRQLDEANSAAAAVAAEREAAETHCRADEHMELYVDLVTASIGRMLGNEQRFNDREAGAR